jgi:gluconolactonase
MLRAHAEHNRQREEAMSNKALAGLAACAALVAVLLNPSQSLAQAPAATPPAPIMPPSLPATHVLDLMTAEGSAALGAQWKVSDVRIVEVPAIPDTVTQFKTTYNVEPRAGAANFDDSKWPTIEAKDLGARRSGGHVAFMWYRAMLTMPAKIGAFDTSNAVAVLNVLVDDYAEVWINGDIPRRSGYPSPATMQGHNMPNRVVLSTKVSAGDKFQVAIFGVNGPISVAPANSIWFREAKLQFYK